MKNKQEKLTRYTYAYWAYLLGSFVTLVAFLILMWASYLTEFQEMVTISHLFLLVLLLGITAYLRMNALHYQQLIVRLQTITKSSPRPANRQRPTVNKQRPRGENPYYEW